MISRARVGACVSEESRRLACFIEKGAPPSRLEVLSSLEFNKLCDSCGSRHWRFFADVESRKRWMIWLNTPDPANDKMGKVVHLKPKPEQPA